MTTVAQQVRGKVCPKVFTEGEFGKGTSKEGLKLCLERARLITQSFKETEGEPMVIRRAKALAKILENMTIYIGDGERIVGNFASDPRSLPWYPEILYKWLEKALDDGYRDLLDEEGKRELKEIHNYWRGKAIEDVEKQAMPDELKKYRGFTGASLWSHYGGVASSGRIQYEKLFKDGLNGRIEKAQQRLKALERDSSIHAKNYIKQRNFLEGAIITLKATINFSKRYADKARVMAQIERDPRRKRELLEISEACDWVPANSPRTFHEALQFFWFIHLITIMIDTHGQGCGIRFDKDMYPFYKKDKDEGRLTREEAQELVEFLWIKFEELGCLATPQAAGLQSGGTLFQTIGIGGVDENGHDLTNELSYIVLDASKVVLVLQPTLAIRYHDNIPQKLIYSTIDLLRTGIGYPAIFNDKAIIPYLVNWGIPIKSARDWTNPGCVNFSTDESVREPSIAARPTNIGHLVLPKCLELALNGGVDKFTAKQLGHPTADPGTFRSVEDIMEAFLKQVNFFVDKMVRIDNIRQAVYEEYYPRPFAAAIREDFDQLELGRDRESPHFSSLAYIVALGPTNVADSLAAIKRLVFEEKRVTMEELLEALRNNWEGKEDLRQICINEGPKFGNDDSYVDFIAREVQYRTEKEAEKFADYFGAPVHLDGSGTSANFTFCFLTGATPDGRKDREPFADSALAPMVARDTKGPTAVLKSDSKIDPILTYNHLLNQKFLPQFLEGENKRLFADYLRTWSDLGIQHIQFNVVDGETLRDAQQHPEKYTNLIVRVAGYSAFFVDLPKNLQDNIVARTGQVF